MNGQVFNYLVKLVKVELNRNVCVDETFYGATRIAMMPPAIDEKCGYNETLQSFWNLNKYEVSLSSLKRSTAVRILIT